MAIYNKNPMTQYFYAGEIVSDVRLALTKLSMTATVLQYIPT